MQISEALCFQKGLQISDAFCFQKGLQLSEALCFKIGLQISEGLCFQKGLQISEALCFRCIGHGLIKNQIPFCAIGTDHGVEHVSKWTKERDAYQEFL